MTLSRGMRIGPYEVVSAIGAGGMGEVFRARDTSLHPDVAVKILPAAFASDPDRLARFTREAHARFELRGLFAVHSDSDRSVTECSWSTPNRGHASRDRCALASCW
jgi:serine/threonine protein kinase